MARLIDASVFIQLERRDLPLAALVAGQPEETFAIASITASELLFGVQRANSADRRARRSAFVESVLATLPVFSLNVGVARAHARVWAQLEAAGQRIGPYDLLVAATALVHRYDVLTFNVREFERVPGLVVRSPDW